MTRRCWHQRISAKKKQKTKLNKQILHHTKMWQSFYSTSGACIHVLTLLNSFTFIHFASFIFFFNYVCSWNFGNFYVWLWIRLVGVCCLNHKIRIKLKWKKKKRLNEQALWQTVEIIQSFFVFCVCICFFIRFTVTCLDIYFFFALEVFNKVDTYDLRLCINDIHSTRIDTFKRCDTVISTFKICHSLL